jgi:hypothetical protein
MVERVVVDVEEVVRAVRFDDWQATATRDREVRQVLRRTLSCATPERSPEHTSTSESITDPLVQVRRFTGTRSCRVSAIARL